MADDGVVDVVVGGVEFLVVGGMGHAVAFDGVRVAADEDSEVSVEHDGFAVNFRDPSRGLLLRQYTAAMHLLVFHFLCLCPFRPSLCPWL